MLYEKFLKNANAKNRAPNSIKSYRLVIGKAEDWLGKPLEDVSFDDIMKYIEYKKKEGLNQTSIWIYEKKLIQFFNFCFNETDDIKYSKIIKRLKNIRVDTPKTKVRSQDILFPEDIKRLINVSTLERDRCLIAVLFEAGLRVGELRALTNDMIQMDEQKQEVVFNVPDEIGCKTGSRSVLCTDVYGYVTDWQKCNTSKKFMPLSPSGINRIFKVLFKKAGINTPSNPHILRHSSITNACILKLQPNQISMRYWGIPNSNSMAVYLHISEQIVNSGYRDAKGLGNGNGNTIINPLAVRCVNCGKLIQSGNLCKPCNDSKKNAEDNTALKAKIAEMEEDKAKQQEKQEAGMEILKEQMAALMRRITEDTEEIKYRGGMRQNDTEKLERYAEKLPKKIARKA